MAPSISHLFFADDAYYFFQANVLEAFFIQHCLNLYEKASGQVVNFTKSRIHFSRNTAHADREAVCNEIQV